MMSKLKRFVSDESGATAIEYGLIATLIAIAVIAAARSVGNNLGSQFNAIRQDFDWVTFLDSDRTQRPYLRMEGTAVFRWAAFEMGKVAHRALEAAKLGSEDLDVFVPHQANARINELLAKNLKLRDDAVVAKDIEYTGNTSAALMGPTYPGAGSTLGPAMVFGYLAALHLAGDALSTAPAQPGMTHAQAA